MEEPMSSEDTASLPLKELVQRFKVCWKVWPEYTYVGDEKRQVGYQLELAGTHEAGVTDPEPGCEHCEHVYNALRQIAEYIMPREERPATYEISPFDRSIHYWGLHSQRPDIMLTIRILHRQGYEQPVDECEDQCLKEMEARLRDLGAGRLQWSDSGTKAAEIETDYALDSQFSSRRRSSAKRKASGKPG
jgi:hypothetical protein